MKMTLTILRALATPIALVCGISVHRVFFMNDKNFLIPLIITSAYTIWYFIDLFVNKNK